MIALDLLRAFDTVNHSALLHAIYHSTLPSSILQTTSVEVKRLWSSEEPHPNSGKWNKKSPRGSAVPHFVQLLHAHLILTTAKYNHNSFVCRWCQSTINDIPESWNNLNEYLQPLHA